MLAAAALMLAATTQAEDDPGPARGSETTAEPDAPKKRRAPCP
jgi:hypothetical protein